MFVLINIVLGIMVAVMLAVGVTVPGVYAVVLGVAFIGEIALAVVMDVKSR